MPEHLLLPGTPVLAKNGRPNPGYSIGAAALYDRRRVRLGFLRRKEWDFYQVYDGRFVFQLVLGHVSYAGQAAMSLLDVREGRVIFRRGLLTPLASGIPRLPASAESPSRLVLARNGVRIEMETGADGSRSLFADWDGICAALRLGAPFDASIVVNTPFDGHPYAFYYNHKLNGMAVSGRIDTPEGVCTFSPDRAFALLDWGRGALPYRHEWLWSSVSATLDGKPFGFNLGRFGSSAFATENIVCYGSEYTKLGSVIFTRGASYCDPWHIAEESGRFTAELTPIYDNDTATRAAFVNNRCHQVFGTFSGFFRCPDGTERTFTGIPGFAEHATNRW